MQELKNILLVIYRYLVKQTEDASHQITLFGIVMTINYPLFGVFWKLDGFQLSEEFFLRLFATVCCALLAFNKFWPDYLSKVLPLFWYFTLLFCLPFFFCYLTLLNHGATLWLMNCVSAIFFLLLVTSALGALVLILLGVGLSFFYFYHLTDQIFVYIPGNISLFSLIITYTAAIIIGALFARDREIIQAGRISGMRLLAGSIAHDLRTPLASIHLETEIQQIILDKLNNSEAQKDLKASLHKISRGIEMSNQLISMQLNNIKREKFDTSTFIIHSIRQLIEKTLADYPLKEGQQSLINSRMEDDFTVWVEEIAFKNLIWNLLKNSFEFIEETGRGDIFIWLEQGGEKDDYNYLHVKDTAKGLYAKTDKIFDSFYSERKDGFGVGLAYCRLLMEAAGGEIQCKGKANDFAHFIMKFPKID